MEVINNECYVSFEIANLLKKAGFDWDTYNAYNKDGVFADKNRNLITWNHFSDYYSAPTLEVAQRWLREVKNISVDISSTCYSEWEYVIRKINQLDHKNNTILVLTSCGFYTYEETKEAGIKKALELILKKKIICQQEKDC